MDYQKILKSLKSNQFTKVTNKGNKFENGATIYAKEIGKNIFLIFVIGEDPNINNIKALIAHFDCFNSIGLEEPKQIMFYLSVKEKEDLHYFEKYLKVSNY